MIYMYLIFKILVYKTASNDLPDPEIYINYWNIFRKFI